MPQEREARERFLFALSDNGIVHVFIGASQHASNGSVGDAEYQCSGIDGLELTGIGGPGRMEKKKCRLKRNESKYVFGVAIPCRANSRYVSPVTSTDQAWGTAE